MRNLRIPPQDQLLQLNFGKACDIYIHTYIDATHLIIFFFVVTCKSGGCKITGG